MDLLPQALSSREADDPPTLRRTWAYALHACLCGEYTFLHLEEFSETSDWEHCRHRLCFEPDRKRKKVALNIVINGRGTVWVDDVRLSIQPLN